MYMTMFIASALGILVWSSMGLNTECLTDTTVLHMALCCPAHQVLLSHFWNLHELSVLREIFF